MNSFTSQYDWRVALLGRAWWNDSSWRVWFAQFIERLNRLHYTTKQCERIMLQIVGVQAFPHEIVFAGVLVFDVSGVSRQDPQDGRQNFVHSLSITNVLVELTEYEEDV